MIKCHGYILYSSAAHATVRRSMSRIPSPQPLLHPQSSQYWALTTSHSLSYTRRIQMIIWRNAKVCILSAVTPFQTGCGLHKPVSTNVVGQRKSWKATLLIMTAEYIGRESGDMQIRNCMKNRASYYYYLR